MTQAQGENRVILVTGPAGAGRTTAINALEDFGFEVIDNLPLSLIPRLLSGPPLSRPLALGVDARNRDFRPGAVVALIDELAANPDLKTELLFLDCNQEVLLRRYSETRRRHPLAPQGAPEDGIARDHELMAPLRARADFLIDTSNLSPHDLRDEIGTRLMMREGDGLAVIVQSFSYKRGMPRGLDMVFDVRFLRNPHWDPNLRPLTGQDPRVGTYVEADPRFATFFAHLTDFTAFLLPAFSQEGKSHLSIGIGCTGGQHRSVFVANKLAMTLADAGWQVSIRHRELTRQDSASTGLRSASIPDGQTGVKT